MQTRAYASLPPSRRFHAVVVILSGLFLHPQDERCDVFMGLQCCPTAVASCKLFLSKRRVNFSVANAMHGMRLAATLAFGHQMMFINTFARNKRPTAERTVAQSHAPVPQRLLASQ